MDQALFNLGFGFYLASCISSLLPLKKLTPLLLSAGLLTNSAYLFRRALAAGHFPVTSLFETIIFFVWAIVLVFLILERIYKLKVPASAAALLAAAGWGYASLLDRSLKPLLPALKSNWLIIHVSSYILAYGCLSLSFIAGLIFLFKWPRSGGEARNNLDRISYSLVRLAFPFLTLGLTTGSVWAKSAWGHYWSWDPKETWALITWLVYAAYLHLRPAKDWQGAKAAVLNIIGFLCLLWTFLGVNYLLPGLHSYL